MAVLYEFHSGGRERGELERYQEYMIAAELDVLRERVSVASTSPARDISNLEALQLAGDFGIRFDAEDYGRVAELLQATNPDFGEAYASTFASHEVVRSEE